MEPTTMKINSVEYVRKDSIATTPIMGDMFIVRTYSAGVFFGQIESRNGKEGKLVNARRLWMWAGAASLSQLAVDGTSKPKECKFPCAVPSVELTEIVEVLACTQKAIDSINSVPVWRQ